MADLQVAWWNLENLFDRETAPGRDPVLKKRLARELKGWTAAVRDRKISQLASVIEKMFNGTGPDLLGVCEVENEGVVERLVDALDISGRNYDVVGHASPDARGIDVSFIVDSKVLRVLQKDHQVVVKRTATRDIFWIEVAEKEGNQRSFFVVGNHWPSRTAGQYESEPFRILTGETVSFIVEQIRAADEDVAILLMGDFNDEPFNRSMADSLLSTRDRDRVTRARNAMLLNMMWRHMPAKHPGTYKFGSTWNMLDSVLANKAMLVASTPVTALQDTVEIFRPPEMVGSSGKPIPFGRPAKKNSFNRDGFSDHFPITMIVETDS